MIFFVLEKKNKNLNFLSPVLVNTRVYKIWSFTIMLAVKLLYEEGNTQD